MAFLSFSIPSRLLCALPLLLSPPLWAQDSEAQPRSSETEGPSEVQARATSDSAGPESGPRAAGPAEDPSQSPGITEPAAPPEPSAAPAWKVGLAHYSVGDHDQALATLRPRLLACEIEQSSCDTDERATLFASLAIVQAGGTGEHRAAVQSFRRALTYRDDLVLLPQYQTPAIVSAFKEAQSGKPAGESPAPERAGSVPLSDDNYDEEDEEEASIDDRGRGNLFLLTMGDVEYLQLEAGNRDLFGRSTARGALELSEGQTLLRGGGDVTAGVIPSDSSGFTFGVRLRGGGIWGDEATPYGSMEAVIGSVMGPRRDHTFFYLLGSFGASYFSKADMGAFSAGFRGGASFGRFSFAACFSTLANENLAGLGIGLQLGLGQLFDFNGS